MRSLAILATAAFIACAHAESTGQTIELAPAVQQPPTGGSAAPGTASSQAPAGFTERVNKYVELHERLEAQLPKLPKEADPTTIDTHQRSLEKLLRAERRNAQQGEILTPETRRHFRQVLGRVLAGKEGAALRATIMDENPGKISLTVNSRYPDQVPVSTIPPQVLAVLPKLPEELEYRFIGDRLILLDVHAHTIVDYMDNALPF
jgi:hypothetical protein